VRAAAILSYVSAGLAFIGGMAINLAFQLPVVAGFGAGIFWLFMAATIRTRRPYMHVVATFVFSLGTLVTLLEPLNEVAFQAVGATPDLIVFETVQWLPALAAFVLLWTRESTGYFRQMERHTRQAVPGSQRVAASRTGAGRAKRRSRHHR
jgi:hypothetical protein